MTERERELFVETEDDAPGIFFRFIVFCVTILGLMAFIVVVSCLLGCTSFYESSGTKTVVGEVSAPVDISDSTDTMACKVLYSLTGASVWSEKGSGVEILYSNNYTNKYFGCVEKSGVQTLSVKVDPNTNKETTDEQSN